MPKQKSHRGLLKRIKLTKSGKVRFKAPNSRHIKSNKTGTQVQSYRKSRYARTGDLHFGAGAARVSVPGLSQARTVKLEADILGENRRIAQQNRRHFEAHGVTALNLLSSPGSGKTTLLCATIEALRARAPVMSMPSSRNSWSSAPAATAPLVSRC